MSHPLLRFSRVTAAALAVAFGLVALVASDVSAADSGPDQVWLISTRNAPWSCPPAGEDVPLDYRQLGPDCRWLPADREAFLASDDPAVPTSVFIPGNRADSRTAIQQGWQLYRELKCRAEGRPFRFVIWSWPADRIRGGNRRDVRVKACRSDVQSYYLARWLGQVGPQVPVCMVGYSYGARIITGALHILAGGQVAGRGLPEESSVDRGPVRAVLVAAAMDSDWLLPDRRNGLALSQLDHLLVLQNCSDPVLKFYPLMYGIGGPEALGRTGPACPGRLGDELEKIELLDVSCSVGRNHDWDQYICAPGLRGRLPWYAFLEPAVEEAQLGGPLLPETAAVFLDALDGEE